MSWLTIRHGALFPCKPEWRIAPQQVHCYCMFFVTAGRGWLSHDQHRLDAAAGDLFLNQPGEIIEAGHDPTEPISVYSIGFHLRNDWGGDALKQQPWPYRMRLRAIESREFTAICKAFVALHQRKPTDHVDQAGAELSLRSELLRAVTFTLHLARTLPADRVDRRPTSRTPEDTRITTTLRHIDEHLADDLSTHALAARCHWSPSHFASVFKQETGAAPAAYIRRKRIDRARQMLATTTVGVAEVAAAVGFDDPYHFSRVFRKLEAMSPTAYRESCKRPFFS